LEFIAEFGLFVLKTASIVVAIAVVIGLAATAKKGGAGTKGQIDVVDLNDHYKELSENLFSAMSTEAQAKAKAKADKKKKKAEKKAAKADDVEEEKPTRFVLDFDGDMQVSNIECLREEINAILTTATERDEVVVKLQSPGGVVHAYGLAAAQLARIKSKGITLTVCVDQVAASGGYMMACVADRIIASPFALVGSIGVVAQIPNFHKLLKRNDIDVEMHTAGKYKRTLTMLGENTEEGREKFKEDLEEIHVMFRDMVAGNRPQIDIDQVATGEVWYGTKALEKNLVDEIMTSDDYLFAGRETFNQYQLTFEEPQTLADRLGIAAKSGVNAAVDRLALLTRRPTV